MARWQRALLVIVAGGLFCLLGACNQAQVSEILSLCEVKPTILQTELHPYHQEPSLKTFLNAILNVLFIIYFLKFEIGISYDDSKRYNEKDTVCPYHQKQTVHEGHLA